MERTRSPSRNPRRLTRCRDILCSVRGAFLTPVALGALGGATQHWAVPHSIGRCHTALGGATQRWAVPHSAGRCHTALGDATQAALGGVRQRWAESTWDKRGGGENTMVKSFSSTEYIWHNPTIGIAGQHSTLRRTAVM
eukprot:gene12205-biopygen5677